MPSLNDIPLQLRNEPDKLTFIRWLSKIPLDYNHKRSLASLWSRDTKIHLTKTDWQLLQTSSLMNPKQNAPTLSTPTTRR